MDIHRARFIPYPPSAINALAFSHASPGPITTKKGTQDRAPDPSCLRLAIGRANGDIEVWNPAKGTWFHEITLHGGKDRSVEGLAWTQEPSEEDENGKTQPGQLRLFSIGYSSTVTEWNLLTGLPLRHSSGSLSQVWCLAAQPKWTPSSDGARAGEFRGQDLAVGCADGTLAILSTEDNELQFRRNLSRAAAKKARVLSVTYQTRDVVVAGFADSAIRVYDARNGAQIRSISLVSKKESRGKETLVWVVQILPNGDIISGDSMGEVRVFDGKTYSSLHRLQTHEADVLSLGVSQFSNLFFSGSTDRRTVVYNQKIAGKKARNQWNRLSHRRYHEHDIKAMAVYEGRSVDVLVSGGLDANPVLVPIRDHGQQYSRTLPIVPHRPPMITSKRARMIVSWWDREARLYRIPHKAEDSTPSLLARLALQGEENISCAALADDGSLLALGTAAGIRVFQLSAKASEPGQVKIRKLDGPEVVGARVLTFSPDARWLAVVTTTSDCRLLRILPGQDGQKASLLRHVVVLQRSQRDQRGHTDGLNGAWGRYDATVVQAAFSSDSRILAVADLGGRINSWVLEGHEDSTAPELDLSKPAKHTSSDDDESSDDPDDDDEDQMAVIKGQHWIPDARALPRLDSSPLILSFRPSSPEHQVEPNGNPGLHPTRHTPHVKSHDLPRGEHRLFVVTARHRFYEFDVLKNEMTSWTKRNPSSNLPEEFRALKDLAKGCFWDTTEGKDRLWLYGSNWLFMFDLSQDFVSSSGDAVAGKKRDFHEVLEQQKESTGAGDVVKGREQEGVGRKIRKITANGTGQTVEWIERKRNKQERDDDDDDDDDVLALPPLQRDTEEDGPNGNGGTTTTTTTTELVSKSRGRGPRYWYTLKYRPILGVAAIDNNKNNDNHGQTHAANGDASTRPARLEVVLVERPFWDLDLPPRFVGPNERDK
ncbi:WD40 repeat-like protein [Pseudovirgaria hyperparasitica]|uniref:WD40 repeat-like protein n=1 Tax=Pseudovirgaria hyperparasitica TaxID=470096 RepID=A0A6A6VZI6_9PEZI|nr:WD40 repeat-like protein [Pseudovirgaria hyperparasitica]KAF2755120.1 WD40 repeat-like protein [Pseudovirgaria hyperparasitica]